jgi:hypothetical protein
MQILSRFEKPTLPLDAETPERIETATFALG